MSDTVSGHKRKREEPAVEKAEKSGKTPKKSREEREAATEKETKKVAPIARGGDDSDAEDAPTGPISPFAKPLAGKKLSKKLYKLVKKAASAKLVKRGVKEVVKALRKDEKSSGRKLCIIAGDISPPDVVSHIPVLCEDSAISYVYVPSKASLGTAAHTKRPTSVVLLTTPKSFDSDDKMKEAISEVTELHAE